MSLCPVLQVSLSGSAGFGCLASLLLAQSLSKYPVITLTSTCIWCRRAYPRVCGGDGVRRVDGGHRAVVPRAPDTFGSRQGGRHGLLRQTHPQLMQQYTPNPHARRFNMVSIAIAVLPVLRSPMINSCCPRPIGTRICTCLRPFDTPQGHTGFGVPRPLKGSRFPLCCVPSRSRKI